MHFCGGEGGCLSECCRAPQTGATPLVFAVYGGCAAVAVQLLAAGADGVAPRAAARVRGEVSAMFVAAEEEAQRLRSIAFAMGLQERLGAASVVGGLEPDLLRMVVERVYPPDNVL